MNCFSAATRWLATHSLNFSLPTLSKMQIERSVQCRSTTSNRTWCTAEVICTLSLAYIMRFIASTASGTPIFSATPSVHVPAVEVPEYGRAVAFAGGLLRLGHFADRLVLLGRALGLLLHGGAQPGEFLAAVVVAGRALTVPAAGQSAQAPEHSSIFINRRR